jgi:hypothetical protein
MLSKLLPTLRTAFVCTVSLLAAVCGAQTINVGPGQTYTTIQAGINAAVNGNTVLVAPGTYYENIDFKGKAITVTSSGGPSVTTIDGGNIDHAVIFQSGEPRAAVLSNFTITHGTPLTSNNYSYTGGGILIQNSQPTILNNVVTQNYCQNIYSAGSAPLIEGNTISSSLTPEKCFVLFTGGIKIDGALQATYGQATASPTVIGNIIEKNTTGQSGDGGGDGGPGIAIWGGSPIIENNIIRNNVTLSGSGGGINVVYGDLISIVQNLIYGNSAGCGGGAIGSEEGSLGSDTYLLIANNTVVGNIGTGNGGYSDCRKTSEVWTAFYEGGGPTIKFVNNIFDASASPALDCGSLQGISGFPIDEAHQSLFDHNLLYDSAGSFFASNCVDTSHLHGNLVADPQFVNAAAYDFHLKVGSPAIDAGNGSVLQNLKNLSNVTLSTDFDGNPREVDATSKGTPTIDMGAYEFAGVVDGTPTRVVLTPSVYTGNAGPLTLTATLSSALGVVGGTVVFSSDGVQLGTANAINGVATLSNVPLGPGVHALLASYVGQAAYPAALSVVVIIDLNKYVGTILFKSSPNPSIVGTPVTFTVNVSEPDGTIPSPITLTYYTGGTLASLQPDASGNATFTTSTIPLGSNYIDATWPGDTTHAQLSAVLVQNVINGYATTTTLSCVPSSIVINGTASLNASVTSTSGTPTGAFTFTDNGAGLGQVTATNGLGSLSYQGQAVGTHAIVATYVPTGNFAGSSASCSEVVTALPTTSVLTVTPTTSTYGSSVMLTATVAPATPPGVGTPAGTVTFFNGAVSIGTGTLASGVASLTLSNLPGGNDNLTCTYGGSTVYAPSNCNTVPVVINAATTVLTLTSNLNPAPALTPVTLTARLTVNGNSAGAGNAISLTLNGQTINLTTDATGSATYTISTLLPGSYPATASFAATSTLLASSASLTEVITAVGTSTSLTVAPNPAYFSQLVTMVAMVSSQTAAVVNSGSVTFSDNGTALGTQSVNSSGMATFTISTLAIGTHPITATFNPASTVFVSSTSTPAVNEVILPSGFTIALNPASLTIPDGATGTVAIQLASVGNFAGPLALTYGPLPTYATASINPQTVTLAAGGTGASTLTLKTLLKASSDVPRRPGARVMPEIFTALALMMIPLSFSKRKKLARMACVALLLVALPAINGCTNAWYTAEVVAPGTYSLLVTATDVNHNSQTATLTVIVTP